MAHDTSAPPLKKLHSAVTETRFARWTLVIVSLVFLALILLLPLAAVFVEAGLAEVPRGWKLDRPAPGILVWTTPWGRRYASTLTGEPLPVPAARRT